MLRLTFTIILFLFFTQTWSQTLGGGSIFNFLKLPASPQLTGLGGINVSVASNDVGMAFYNPALLTEDMHTRVNLVFNDFYAGITSYHAAMAWKSKTSSIRWAGGIQYINYGEVAQTDASGNLSGTFRPRDWVMQVSAANSYKERWDYGGSLKFIHSGYGIYRSSGVAVDFGLLYKDTANGFRVSVLARNMGLQLRAYAGTDPDDLPFDLQLGMTKRLKDAPFSFSVTVQRLHQFDIRYNDTLFNNDVGITNDGRKFTFDKLFRHFILAAQIHPSPQLEFTVAYNHLRRQELNLNNTANGLNGFSLGVGVLLKKIQIRYARSHYQNNTGMNQFGLALRMGDYVNWD